MKVAFRNLLKAYSGQVDGLVYYYNSKLDKILCRRYVIPEETAQNVTMGAKSRNLSELQPSEAFQHDLKHYAAMISTRGKYLNWRNCYIKLMYQLEKLYNIDLLSLTRDSIYQNSLPCITVSQAIDAGLLEPVDGYQRFNSTF